MSLPHHIRLRGPWEYEVVTRASSDGRRADATPPAASDIGRITLPSDWGDVLGAQFRGRVRFSRRFGQPSGLEPHQRVRLVCEGIDPRGTVSLNDHMLGESPGYALPVGFDVTDLLRPRNRLVLEIDFPFGSSHPRPGREHLPGGPIGQVRLEIVAANWLDRFWLEVRDDGPQAQLYAGGVIAGPPAEHPLELIIRGPSRKLFYAEVQPGEPLAVVAGADDLPRWSQSAAPPVAPLTVKLFDRATSIWQQGFLVGRRTVAWQADTRTLLIAGCRCTLPEEVDVAEYDTVAPSSSTRLLYSPRIMHDAWYTQADRAVRSIIQQVPRQWSAAVCLRLAHHPSIVAWTTTASELQSMSAASCASTHGRPWIPLDVINT